MTTDTPPPTTGDHVTLDDVGLTDEPQFGVLRWTDDDETIHLDLGLWEIGVLLGLCAHDRWHQVYIDGERIYSFTPCVLVEAEAVDRLRNQQGHAGLGVTTSAALDAFFEHIEAMKR